jgi:hypothetical protein
MSRCQKCGGQLVLADPDMVRHWLSLTTGRNLAVTPLRSAMCPACDAYVLGAELEHPLPYYSAAIAAFVTVNDWDCFNRDTADCDIREWPEFGCLSFSESALHSAVKFVREARVSPNLSTPPPPLHAQLVGPTGIPDDTRTATEWEHQLGNLHSRMRGEYSSDELDTAIRRLIGIIV